MTRKCEQKKCAYLNTGMCPICSECNAKSDIVSENCVKCWNCEHDEGILRGHTPKDNEIEITITQTEPTEIDKETMKSIQEKMQEILNKR